MSYSIHDSIAFFETIPENATAIENVQIEIGGIISQAQLKTLKDVKRELAARAHRAGGNAIVNFSYGQKSVGFLRSLFQLDDVNWHGSGTIAIVSFED